MSSSPDLADLRLKWRLSLYFRDNLSPQPWLTAPDLSQTELSSDWPLCFLSKPHASWAYHTWHLNVHLTLILLITISGHTLPIEYSISRSWFLYFYFYVYIFLHGFVYSTLLFDTQKVQNRVRDSLELRLQLVVSLHVGSWNQTHILYKSNKWF